MQGNHVFFSVHVPGTLSADITSIFKAPFPLQLVKVSAVNSTANTPKLAIGTTSASAAYMTLTDIGVSNSPVELDKGDFVGSQPIHIAAGSNVQFTLDYDASGSAGANYSLVADFTEG